jgi:hypothetical protein
MLDSTITIEHVNRQAVFCTAGGLEAELKLAAAGCLDAAGLEAACVEPV